MNRRKPGIAIPSAKSICTQCCNRYQNKLSTTLKLSKQNRKELQSGYKTLERTKVVRLFRNAQLTDIENNHKTGKIRSVCGGEKTNRLNVIKRRDYLFPCTQQYCTRCPWLAKINFLRYRNCQNRTARNYRADEEHPKKRPRLFEMPN